ncbi:MAG: Similar to F420-dependent glucose-6-phosphate dehydrogenase, Mext_1273 family, partial [uncultured Gemmatimonadaceae bacterium]
DRPLLRPHRLPLLPRAVPTEPAARARAGRGGGRLHRRPLVRPPPAVERAPGRERLRLELARGGARGHTALVRRGQRPRAALPPGDHRAGRRHAGRDVPGPLLDRRRQRPAGERGDHRRAVADQVRPQRAPPRVRSDHARALGRRDGHAPGPRRRRGGPALVAARAPPTPRRRGGHGADGRVGGGVGRRAHHRAPAAARAAGGGGRVAARRGRGEADVPQGAALLRRHRRRGAPGRARPVAHQRLPERRAHGAAHRGAVRRRGDVRPAGGARPLRAHLRRPGAPRGVAARRPGAGLLAPVPAQRQPRPGAVRRRLRRARPPLARRPAAL